MTFIHLNVASSFSWHYGTATPAQLVEAAVEAGQSAAAITDRDGLYGAIEHVRAALAAGIDPIVGARLAIAPEATAEAGHERARRGGVDVPRVTVLAHGHAEGSGWAALCRLVSAAHARKRRDARGVYLRPERWGAFVCGEGEPACTVLLGPDSDVGLALLAGRGDEAHAALQRWRAVTGGAVAIEVACLFSRPGTSASLGHAAELLALAEHTRTPAVLTGAVRYLAPEDAATADVLDAAGELAPLGSFLPQPNGQAWLKPEAKMVRLAHLIAQHAGLGDAAAAGMIAESARIADRTRLHPDTDLGWRKPKVPELEVIGVRGDPDQVLWQRCLSGLNERFAGASEGERSAALARLSDELATIRAFGYASYFLTVAETSAMMRDMGVRNQARGSAAGSLVVYLLRISNVNPLEHDLLFERFLGRVRSTLPDIDIDVESARRHDVYRAIVRRFGEHRVSLLSMQNAYRARGAIRDAGLALGLPESSIDRIAKTVWRLNARDVSGALHELPELRELAEEAGHDERIELLLAATERLDRLPRHLSMHPCGVILGNSSLLSTTPVQPSELGLPMSQFGKDDIDDAGLIKLDVLGVRMQSTLASAVREIARIHGPRAARAGGLDPDAPFVSPEGVLAIDELPHHDEATFQAIQSTHTLGMFQIESPGQRELVGKMQPDEYEDLIADISLFRPGPMKGNMVKPFIDVKLGFASPDYLHPRFIPFLESTYGVVIYHEQVIRILADCTGIDLGEADEWRRRMGHELDEIEAEFRRRTRLRVSDGGSRLFTDADIDRIWGVLAGFGSFGFCRAHGAAFALPTWQSAWLKTHYPAEFMAGILTHDPGMYPKRLLLSEVRRLGVPILPLDVNRSEIEYTVEQAAQATDGRGLGVRLALTGVHGMSGAEQQRILEHRPYSSVHDFFERARPSRPLIERLALIGALDSLAPDATRGEVIARVRTLTAHQRRRPEQADRLPFELDDTALTPLIASRTLEPSPAERVAAELDILSMETSGHVLDSYRPLLDHLEVTPADQLLSLRQGTETLVAGIRVATQTPPMRSGKRVVFISLDDGTGCADTAFFDEAQEQAGPLLFGTRLLVIRGTTRRTGARGISLQATAAWDLRELWREYREDPRRVQLRAA